MFRRSTFLPAINRLIRRAPDLHRKNWLPLFLRKYALVLLQIIALLFSQSHTFIPALQALTHAYVANPHLLCGCSPEKIANGTCCCATAKDDCCSTSEKHSDDDAAGGGEKGPSLCALPCGDPLSWIMTHHEPFLPQIEQLQAAWNLSIRVACHSFSDTYESRFIEVPDPPPRSTPLG